MKISVVISAYNEELKIEDCLRSVKKIADEIIFIDNTSSDGTVEIAKRYTDKVYIRENNLMLNVNKNFGFSKATNEWILNLDADERVTESLAKEILDLIENNAINGYFIPRKNIIFGRWIEHTGWYPDYQLRLFRRSSGKFEEEHVHELVNVNGATDKLTHPMEHLNYENITQFLNKMVKTYTVSEADNMLSKGYIYNSFDIIKMPVSEFIKRYFAEKGYKDGMHGLTLSLLMAFYHFVVFTRLWEANNYVEDKNPDKILKEGGKLLRLEFKHWIYNEKIVGEKNILKKNLYRVRRKVLS